MAQEGQQMAERAFPSKRGHRPVAVHLQSQVNRRDAGGGKRKGLKRGGEGEEVEEGPMCRWTFVASTR